MTHSDVEKRELVEAYVRGRLTPEDKTAFEEHFFACDDCFEEVRATEQFIKGVRRAAESGTLPAAPPERAPFWSGWLPPAFACSMAATAILAVVTGWLALVELPRSRSRMALEKTRLEQELAQAKEAGRQLAAVRPPEPEANLPLAMLEASRSTAGNQITIPAGATRVVLWIDLDPGARFDSFNLELRRPGGDRVANIEGLVRNQQGALSAGVPADRLSAGTYAVLLSGRRAGRDALVGEYRLIVRR